MEKLHTQHKESDIFFVRHAESAYKTYVHILKSANPQEIVKFDEQIENDLTEEGAIIARKEAIQLMSGFDLKKDILFFVSSRENRALETARIYREVALELGLKIIKQDNKYRENHLDIRELVSLSLRNVRPFVISVFTPNQHQSEINWSAVDNEEKEKWMQARNIILEKDYGNWGNNFYHYADAVKDIFPEIKTPLELFHTQFKKIQRLVLFARNKINETDQDTSVKVLAFGHEDYMSIALEREFFKKDFGHCETVFYKIIRY